MAIQKSAEGGCDFLAGLKQGSLTSHHLCNPSLTQGYPTLPWLGI